MAWSLSQQTTTQAGTVRYDLAGSGPDLVLVHGTPWSSFCWHRVIPALARRFRVHWYDLPGYGRSQMAADQRISLDVQSVVLGEMLDHWGLACPLVVGHDFGGAITLRAHLLAGRDFERLVLLNAVALAPWAHLLRTCAHARRGFLGLPAYIHKAVVEAYIRGALAAPLPPGDFDGLVAPWLTEEGQPAFYRQIAQADQRIHR
ncbi:MAG: alpha/beta fold hydrolase [Hyphomicrobiaceae bacterium]